MQTLETTKKLTVHYTPELYEDICQDYAEYFQTGYTVCGAQDPAFIVLSDEFAERNPLFAKYKYVRIIDKFRTSWSSWTLLEFSNLGLTDEEDELYKETI